MDDIRRGWSAPLLLVILSTLMMVPVSALVMMVVTAVSKDTGTATAFAGIIQIVGTFWIAGVRLRRSGR